jgi:hypothetical protein
MSPNNWALKFYALVMFVAWCELYKLTRSFPHNNLYDQTTNESLLRTLYVFSDDNKNRHCENEFCHDRME